MALGVPILKHFRVSLIFFDNPFVLPSQLKQKKITQKMCVKCDSGI